MTFPTADDCKVMAAIEILRTLPAGGKQIRFGLITSESTEGMRNAIYEAGALTFSKALSKART